MAAARKAKTSSVLTLLIAVASLLGALVLVSLWGAKLYCGERPIAVIKEPKKKRAFWKRKQVQQIPTEPSAVCRTVWRVLDSVPYLTDTTTERPAETDAATCTKEKKKNPLQKLLSVFSRKKSTTSTATRSKDAALQTAFSQEFHATKSQEKLMHRMAHQFRDEMDISPHVLDERLNNVAWGGHSKWWLGHDGGPLLAAYLRIMDWPQELTTHFPFKLCKDGCPAAFALQHTFAWRETFQPWMMCPAAIQENANGFVYFRGRAKSLQPLHDDYGHGMVWIRAAAHDTKPDPTWYFRALLNSLDLAVSDTLQRSHNKVGKFNVVIDANGASFGLLPSLGDMKKGILMLQDHYPNRLGIVVLANFSRVSEFLLTMIKPLITKEVRDKIYILPKDAVKRQQILETIVEEEYIPDYLGGQDTYRFDANEYYSDATMQFSDQQATEYLTAMPYHA